MVELQLAKDKFYNVLIDEESCIDKVGLGIGRL